MCLLDLLVMKMLKVPELTTLSSSVTMPSYVVQFTKFDLCLYKGSNTQFLPKLAFNFSLGTLH